MPSAPAATSQRAYLCPLQGLTAPRGSRMCVYQKGSDVSAQTFKDPAMLHAHEEAIVPGDGALIWLAGGRAYRVVLRFPEGDEFVVDNVTGIGDPLAVQAMADGEVK